MKFPFRLGLMVKSVCSRVSGTASNIAALGKLLVESKHLWLEEFL